MTRASILLPFIASLSCCVISSAARAEQTVEFAKDSVSVKNGNTTEFSLNLSDAFDLPTIFEKLPVRNADYQITLGYEEGDGIGAYITVRQNGIELFSIFGDVSSKKISSVWSGYSNATSDGLRIGEDIISKFGDTLVCNFELYSFCENPRIAAIRYHLDINDACPEIKSIDDRRFKL